MIICAGKIQSRIEQTRFLQSQVNRISSLGGAESPRTQTLVGLAWIFVPVGQSGFQTAATAAFKHTQNVSRLRDFPTGQRIKEGQGRPVYLFFPGGVWGAC